MIFDRGHLALGVLLCLVAGVGLAGWLRSTDPPAPDRAVIPAVVAADVRSYFETQELTVEYLAVTRVVGDRAWFTMKLADYMPSAERFTATVKHGWHVDLIEPVRGKATGP